MEVISKSLGSVEGFGRKESESCVGLEIVNQCLIIKINKELDHHSADLIRMKTDKMFDRGNFKNVIFDFGNVDFMDSSGIGVIMGRYKKVLYLGGHVAVTNVGKNINRVLKFSGLYNIVSLHQSNTEALECFSGKKK